MVLNLSVAQRAALSSESKGFQINRIRELERETQALLQHMGPEQHPSADLIRVHELLLDHNSGFHLLSQLL